MRRLCCATGVLLSLALLGCLGESQRRPDLELYLVADAVCSDCEVVDFLNAYVDSPFLIRRDATVRFSTTDMSAITPVRVDDEIRRRTYWMAKIELSQNALREVDELTKDTISGRVVAFKVLGTVIDVIPASHIRSILDVGRFDTLERLRAAFPGATRDEIARVVESDPKFDAFMNRFEKDLEEDERLHEELTRSLESKRHSD